MIIELSFHMTEYYNVSICKCKDVIVLAIHNLITYQLFQVARPARQDRRRRLPHAAHHFGCLRGVMYGLALRAMSLRDGISLPYDSKLN